MIPLEYAFDENIQKQILAMVVRYPQFVESYPNVVKAEFFTDPVNQTIAAAYLEKQDGSYYLEPSGLYHIVKQNDSSKGIHDLALKKRIKELFSIETSDKLIAEEAIKFAKHQATIRFIVESAENLSELARSDGYSKLQDELRDIVSIGDNIKDEGMDIFDQDPKDVLESVYKDRIPSGYKVLDSMIEGGLGKGELGVILAPPSTGKSFAVQDMAVSAMIRRKRTTVVIFTLEMSKQKYARRLYTRMTGIAKDDLVKDVNEIPRRLKIFQSKTNSRLIIKQFGRATTKDIDGFLMRLRHKGIVPDVVFVDYADLLYPEHRRQERRFEISDTYRELRELAVIHDLPIWTPSQGNRKSYKKEIVDIDDMAEDFSKAMTADIIVALCRTADERVAGEARFFIAKNRDSDDKVQIKVMMDFKSMRIREMYRV